MVFLYEIELGFVISDLDLVNMSFYIVKKAWKIVNHVFDHGVNERSWEILEILHVLWVRVIFDDVGVVFNYFKVADPESKVGFLFKLLLEECNLCSLKFQNDIAQLIGTDWSYC